MTDPAPAVRPTDEARPEVLTVCLQGQNLSAVLREVERHYLSYVMTEARGNKAKAARLAGLADDTFRRKIACYTVTTVFRCA